MLDYDKCWRHYLEMLSDLSSVWQIQTAPFFIFEEIKGKMLEIRNFDFNKVVLFLSVLIERLYNPVNSCFKCTSYSKPAKKISASTIMSY